MSRLKDWCHCRVQRKGAVPLYKNARAQSLHPRSAGLLPPLAGYGKRSTHRFHKLPIARRWSTTALGAELKRDAKLRHQTQSHLIRTISAIHLKRGIPLLALSRDASNFVTFRASLFFVFSVVFKFFAFFRVFQIFAFFARATWHPPCINTLESAETGEN
jgi:hypothetical protein